MVEVEALAMLLGVGCSCGSPVEEGAKGFGAMRTSTAVRGPRVGAG